MRLIFLGNFKPPFSSENDWKWTFEKLGHTVFPLQEDEVTAEQVTDRVRQEKADLFWWVRTWPLKGDGLRMLRELPCPSVAYHLDLWAPLPRGKTVAAEPWWHCNFVFSPDGGSDHFWREHGIHHFYMRPGVVERDCYRAEPVAEYRSDVVFVGSYHYHPEWRYRPKLIDWLKETYGPRFRHWGGNGNTTARGHKLNQVYASAKVAVGDSLCVGFDHPHYWSDRIHESTGRGGVIVHPWIRGLEECYEDGHEAVFYRFNDWGGLKARIDHLIEDDAERERIRQAGHERTKREHTYTQRLTDALRVVIERA